MNINKYLTLFNNNNEYEDFYGDKSKGYNYPNTSYALEEKDVHYEPIDKASSIVLNKYSFTFKKGETEQLTATVLPSTSTIGNVVWKSSNCRVATVDQNGLVTAVALTGSCDIYAMTFDGSNLTATCHCELEYYPVTSVTLNYNVMAIDVEGTGQLIATVEPSKACQDVVWGSSDPSIVSVDSNGLVKAEAISGDAVVTVTTVDQGLTASCAVHIDFHPVSGVTLNTDYLEFLPDGESTQALVATVLPTDATIQDVTWSSSDETIATVDQNGVVTATALGENTGTCIITVTTVDNAYTAECEVKVKPDYDTRYLTIRQLNGGPSRIIWSKTSSAVAGGYLSFDGGTTWSASPQGFFSTSGAGATVMFKRVYQKQGTGDGYESGTIFSSDQNVDWVVEGNIMSLVYGDDFVGKDNFGAVTDKGLFQELFGGTGFGGRFNIVSADDLSLPATSLTESCYAQMLSKTNIKRAPKLTRAKVLGRNCYSGMFFQCYYLKSVPELKPTEIGMGSFRGMFGMCTSLTKVPAIESASTFGDECFVNMYRDCTNLTELPESLFKHEVQLPSSGCNYMFSGCTSLTAVSENLLENVTSAGAHTFDGMFRGCTSLVTPPKLPVKPTSSGVYANMFSGCTSLTTLPIIQSDSTYNVASSGFNGMFADCTSLTEIPEGYLSNVTGVSTYAFNSMFSGCTSLTAVPEGLLPVKDKLAYACYRYMFAGCTNITSGPALPTYNLATNNANYCYEGMYSGCTNLNEITCMAVSGITTGRTRNWAVGVAPTGTFYKHKDATAWVVDSVSSIPPGWTAVDINIEMNKPSTALAIGESERLYAITTPEGRSQDVVWASSDESIATVDKNGVVTAVGTGGTVIISATSVAYGITTTCKVGVNMEGTCFTIVANEASNLNIYPRYRVNISASTDNGGSWTQLPQLSTTSYSLNPNDKVMLKGKWSGGYTTSGVCTFSGSTGNFEAEGNVMSLMYGDDFSGKTDVLGGGFERLFYQTNGLTSASMMVLPATTLVEKCYYQTFKDCVNLKYAPKLPATTLVEKCYYEMFMGCTSLIAPPIISATTLADNCYTYMFCNCTSLTKGPELPATTLAPSCYYGMFMGAGLSELPELPATTLTASCYSYMFQSCRNLTSVPTNYLQATELADNCYNGMFRSCSGLTSLPELPATVMANGCYSGMFENCSALTNLPELPATQLASSCYDSMFKGCRGLVSVPTDYLKSTQLASSCYASMFSGCTHITSVPELPATILANNCYENMFSYCINLTSLPTDYLQSTQLAPSCYKYMFGNCTGLTSVQTDLLPATTLADSCYCGMFSYCRSITSIPDLPARDLAPTCYSHMFDNCSGITEITLVISPESGTIPANACSYMFNYCLGLTTVPENMLPATTLSSNCYKRMFANCRNLTTHMILPAPDLVEGCYVGMYEIDGLGTWHGSLQGLTCLCMTKTTDNNSPIDSMLTWQRGSGGTLYRPSDTETSWRVEIVPGGWVPSDWTIADYNP